MEENYVELEREEKRAIARAQEALDEERFRTNVLRFDYVESPAIDEKLYRLLRQAEGSAFIVASDYLAMRGGAWRRWREQRAAEKLEEAGFSVWTDAYFWFLQDSNGRDLEWEEIEALPQEVREWWEIVRRASTIEAEEENA